jgi:hypothetical protein
MTDEAVRAGRRAVQLLPVTADAAPGPFLQTYRGQIYVLTGELDQAIATLRPCSPFRRWISPAELTSDPLWTPLRKHPGFALVTLAP